MNTQNMGYERFYKILKIYLVWNPFCLDPVPDQNDTDPPHWSRLPKTAQAQQLTFLAPQQPDYLTGDMIEDDRVTAVLLLSPTL